jgi:hypothetical protein
VDVWQSIRLCVMRVLDDKPVGLAMYSMVANVIS